MSMVDKRGHRVPVGSDASARRAITDLSLSIPSIKACASPTAAAQHVQELAAAGVQATPQAPVYVWRTDVEALFVWNGTRWTASHMLAAELEAVGDMPVGNGLSKTEKPAVIKAGRWAGSLTEVAFGNLYADYVYFTTPFPTDCVSVTLTPLYGTGAAGWNFKNAQQLCVDVMSRAGFRAMLPGVTTEGRHAFSWTAVGY